MQRVYEIQRARWSDNKRTGGQADGRTGGQTSGQADGRTGGRADGAEVIIIKYVL